MARCCAQLIRDLSTMKHKRAHTVPQAIITSQKTFLDFPTKVASSAPLNFFFLRRLCRLRGLIDLGLR